MADRKLETRDERSWVIGYRSDAEFPNFLLSPFHLFLPPFASLRALRGKKRLIRLWRLLACSSSIPAAFPCKIVCRFYAPRHVLAVRSKPSLLTWITCDGVHIDPASGKHTILGVFSNIQARSFPVVHPYMVWFLTLTDVQPGKHMIKMSMGLDPTNPGELLHREFESQSPLHRINLINELRNLSFDQPGEYSILIEVDDEPILATNLIVS